MYSNLFTKCKIGKRTAVNRFVAQPMETNNSTDGGEVSEQAIKYYTELAKGQWGIIIIEAISVTNVSLARKNGMVINKRNLNSFKFLIESIKKENPNTIVLFQITHSGSNSGEEFSLRKNLYQQPGSNNDVFTTHEVDEIIDLFVEAILLSEIAGADGVDLKMCHGYFGGEILRPANVRNDKYGGSFENRTRFFSDILEKVRPRILSEDFIIGSRISFYEGIRGGFGTQCPDSMVEELNEPIQLLKLMDSLNLDYVNVSAGIPAITPQLTRPVKGNNLQFLNMLRYSHSAKTCLTALNSKIKVIGSAYSVLKEEGVALADENISKSLVDFVGWGRQNFADPLFPLKIMNGESVLWCTACSGCSKLLSLQLETGCILYNKYFHQLHQNRSKN